MSVQLKRRIFSAAAATMFAAASLTLAAAPASAAPALGSATLAGCQLFASQPIYQNAAIIAGGSWSGCPTGTQITVVLREDRSFFFDRTVTSRSGSGSFGSLSIAFPCGTHFDPIKVFTETRMGDTHVQSPRSTLPCA